MNSKHQENGALTGPLIFTLRATNFVAILRVDWLDGTHRAALPAKPHGWEWDLAPTAPRRTGPERCPEAWGWAQVARQSGACPSGLDQCSALYAQEPGLCGEQSIERILSQDCRLRDSRELSRAYRRASRSRG